MIAISILKSFNAVHIRSLIILLSILFLTLGLYPFQNEAQAQASCPGEFIPVTLTTRGHDGTIARNIPWILYAQGDDADGEPYHMSVLGQSNTGEAAWSTICYNVLSIPSTATGLSIKVFDKNANVGNFSIWELSITSHVLEIRMSSLKVVLRDADGSALKNRRFEVHTQQSDVDGEPIIDETVSSFLTTDDEGVKEIYVSPGTYMVKIPAIGQFSYTENNLVVTDENQRVFDYRLSNVHVVARDGNGDFIPNQAFDVYVQERDAAGLFIEGTRVGSYTTGLDGFHDLFLPTGTYAFKFRGTGTFINLWNQEIDVSKNHTINFSPSGLRIVVRGIENKLLSSVGIGVFEQARDANNQPAKGRRIASGNTGVSGLLDFYIPPGIYIVETTGPDGQAILFENIEVREQDFLAVAKTLSALKYVIRDADNNLVKNRQVTLFEQDFDGGGNPIKGRTLRSKNTNEAGFVEFYFPDDEYIVEIRGDTKLPYKFTEVEIEEEDTRSESVNLSVVRVVSKEADGILAKNVIVNIYEQERDLVSNPTLGDFLKRVDTGESGFSDIFVPQGEYALVIGTETQFNVKVSTGLVTQVNVIRTGELAEFGTISQPRPPSNFSNGSLLRSGVTGKVYVIIDNVIRYIGSPEVFSFYGYDWGNVIDVSEDEINAYEDGGELTIVASSISDGDIVKGVGSTAVYLIEGDSKRPFLSERAFLGNGYQWDQVLSVNASALNEFTEGSPVAEAVSNEALAEGDIAKASGKPAVFLIQNGNRRAFLSGEAFLGAGYQWGQVKTVSESVLDAFPEGAPFGVVERPVGEGSLIKIAGNPRVYVIRNGARRAIVSERVFLTNGFLWGDISVVTEAKLDEYTDGGDLDFDDNDGDRDGLTDEEESTYGTDPNNEDSDSDGYYDGQEVKYGYSPIGEGPL